MLHINSKFRAKALTAPWILSRLPQPEASVY